MHRQTDRQKPKWSDSLSKCIWYTTTSSATAEGSRDALC